MGIGLVSPEFTNTMNTTHQIFGGVDNKSSVSLLSCGTSNRILSVPPLVRNRKDANEGDCLDGGFVILTIVAVRSSSFSLSMSSLKSGGNLIDWSFDCSGVVVAIVEGESG